jgi:glycosyltransferase involved in cell wall biosynthesis
MGVNDGRASAPSAGDAGMGAPPPRRSAWVVTLYYTHGWEQGGHLRTFAVAREWVRSGAEVHFIALEFDNTDPVLPGPYLARLREEGVITGFDRIRLRHPTVRGKLARGALHPLLRDVILGPERRAMRAELDAVARRVRPDLFVFTDRHLLFAAPRLRRIAPVAIDWKDSYHLQHGREARDAARRGDRRAAAAAAFAARDAGLEEGFYGARADHNVLVSPIDAAALARDAGRASRVHTVPNGIRDGVRPPDGPREAARLIFTGAMDFPPNHYSALWFADQVLPRVVARRPDVRFVLAGSNPGPALRALAGPNVEITGWVDDMRAELSRAALYVAPMTSGSGFKNKVVEALAAGRNVVGTSLAFEFLPDRLRSLFTAADDPEALAAAVLSALDDAAGNDAAVRQFWERAGDEFDWARVSARFAAAVA